MNRLRQLLLRREATTMIALVLVVIVFSILNPLYLSGGNLVDVIDQATINGLLALGITFVIITGGIDRKAGLRFVAVGAVVRNRDARRGFTAFGLTHRTCADPTAANGVRTDHRDS